MSTRLCLICLAPYDVVQHFSECLVPGTDAIYFIGSDMQTNDIVLQDKCVRFGNSLDINNKNLQNAFTKFAPTDVVLVCEHYDHDAIVETILSWSRASGFAPSISVYQNGILYGGYLEVIRQFPGLSSPTTGK